MAYACNTSDGEAEMGTSEGGWVAKKNQWASGPMKDHDSKEWKEVTGAPHPKSATSDLHTYAHTYVVAHTSHMHTQRKLSWQNYYFSYEDFLSIYIRIQDLVLVIW